MVEPDLGFKLVWTNYTGFAEGAVRVLKRGQARAARPKAHTETFATKAEAEAAQARLRATHGDGVVATVVPVTLKAGKPAPALLDDWPVMTKRLTK